MSSDVLPMIREWPRTSATVLSAYIKPGIAEYLTKLEITLKELGFEHQLLIMQATGGTSTIPEILRRPVYAMGSGPAAGPAAGAFIAAPFAWDNLITADMGGTSFDVSLITDGRPAHNEGGAGRPSCRSGSRLSRCTRLARAAEASRGSTRAAHSGWVPRSAGSNPGSCLVRHGRYGAHCQRCQSRPRLPGRGESPRRLTPAQARARRRGDRTQRRQAAWDERARSCLRRSFPSSTTPWSRRSRCCRSSGGSTRGTTH